MTRTLVVVGLLLGADAVWACPTCVGPRLETSDAPVEVRAGTAVGADLVDGHARFEVRSTLSAVARLERATVAVDAPLVWRDLGDAKVVSAGDLALSVQAPVLRLERPEASQTLVLGLGLVAPTGQVLEHAPLGDWWRQVGSGAVSASAGLFGRHSDQGWAVYGGASGTLPVHVRGAYAFGPKLELVAGAEWEALDWLRVRGFFDFRHLAPVRQADAVAPGSQMSALFVGTEASARWKVLQASAGVLWPLFCLSPGGSTHARVYRVALGVELG